MESHLIATPLTDAAIAVPTNVTAKVEILARLARQLERTLHAKERELAELRKAWVSAYTSLGADEATANVIVNNEIAAYRATIQSVSAAPQEITASDREMIDAIIDGHYERWGSAVKGDLHGMLFLGGKQAQHRAAPQEIIDRLQFVADNASTVIPEEIEEVCDAAVRLLRAPQDGKAEHPNTEACGFDRSASLTEDTYVCTCGYRTPRGDGSEE